MKKYFKRLKNIEKKKFVRILEKKIENEEKCFVITANPEMFMLGKRYPDIDEMLCDRQCVIVPDGIGLILAGRRLGYEMKERIPGVEICEDLLKYADKHKKKLFLFGASKEVIGMLVNKIHTEFSGIDLCGYENGYVKDKQKTFEKIAELQPDIVLVALGMPVQERLIYNNLDKFEKGIFIGVGGSFDVLSGYKKRAPKFFVKLNIEWLYRIVKEPKRLKRFWDNNVKFLMQIKK